jgi:hypothetical protein
VALSFAFRLIAREGYFGLPLGHFWLLSGNDANYLIIRTRNWGNLTLASASGQLP